MNRRRFIGWGAAGGAVAAAAALGIAETSGGSAGHGRGAGPPPPAAFGGQDAVHHQARRWRHLPTSPAIIAENAKTGTSWWVTTPQNAGDIEGYASQVSAVVGDHVTLHVNTKADQFHVEAYRMGYYQGIGARKVWAVGPGAGSPPGTADPDRDPPTPSSATGRRR